MRTKIIITMERDYPNGDGTFLRHRVQQLTHLETLNAYRFPEHALAQILSQLEGQFPEQPTQPNHGREEEKN